MKLTKQKVKFCKCQICRNMCTVSPCLPSPEDVVNLMANGFKDKLILSEYRDKKYGFYEGIEMVAPRIKKDGSCVFFNSDRLCDLHELGLKPILGKLADHDDAKNSKNIKVVIERHLELQREWKKPMGVQIIEDFRDGK